MLLVTGIMASGKSTVAQLLAERLPRSVHLRGDVFRRMIVGGRAQMTAPLSAEAAAQLDLRHRLAAEAAERYLEAGFTVVYQDILLGTALSEAVRRFRDAPLYVIVLCPSAEAVAAREAARSKKGYRGITVEYLDRALREETPRLGLWLDTSALTPAETATRILEGLDEARVAAP